MRLATFNVFSGRSPDDGRADPSPFADAVRELDADVVALQEVDRFQPRSGSVDQAAAAAKAAGVVEHRYAAALVGTPGEEWSPWRSGDVPDGPSYGIALMSRHPVSAWSVLRLPPVPVPVPFRGDDGRLVLVHDEPRVALCAVVRTPEGQLTVVATHLSFIRWWNVVQLHRLRSALADGPRPLVLLGDLNMPGRRAGHVSRMRPVHAEPTFPAHAPVEQIDHALLDGDLAVSDARVVRAPVSDHRALVVDLS